MVWKVPALKIYPFGAPFSASFSTPFLAPSKINFLSLQSHPGEPTSARIDSSGAHFGNLEPNSKKGGPRNGPPNRRNDLIFFIVQWPFLAPVLALVS